MVWFKGKLDSVPLTHSSTVSLLLKAFSFFFSTENSLGREHSEALITHNHAPPTMRAQKRSSHPVSAQRVNEKIHVPLYSEGRTVNLLSQKLQCSLLHSPNFKGLERFLIFSVGVGSKAEKHISAQE